MKVFGIAVVVRLFFAFKANQFKGLVEAVIILGVGLVVALAAFGIGWLAATGSRPATRLTVASQASSQSPVAGEAVVASSKMTALDWLKGIGGVAVMGFLIYSGATSSGYKHRAAAPASAADAATAIAANLSVGLPRMISSDSRLDSVVADPGRAVIYNYTMVGTPNANMDAETTSRFRQLVVAATCGGSSSDLFAQGIAIRDRYAREDGYVFADVTVRPEDCPQLIPQQQTTAGTLEASR
jgi:hypothetical protein